MGLRKVNTTAYHPQGDGLVERFNRTLTEMLSKTVEKNGKNWDDKLPYVLFAYRTSVQESTRESPFHLLYGRDPSREATTRVLSLRFSWWGTEFSFMSPQQSKGKPISLLAPFEVHIGSSISTTMGPTYVLSIVLNRRQLESL